MKCFNCKRDITKTRKAKIVMWTRVLVCGYCWYYNSNKKEND